MVEDSDVVQTAADAAEKVLFSRCDRSAVTDFDITVSFEDDVLEVDVYLNVEDDRIDEQQVADDAALAARGAVDELLS
ncbi:MAG: DUF3194 domain-containing protein [Halapricum sp.]